MRVRLRNRPQDGTDHAVAPKPAKKGVTVRLETAAKNRNTSSVSHIAIMIKSTPKENVVINNTDRIQYDLVSSTEYVEGGRGEETE